MSACVCCCSVLPFEIRITLHLGVKMIRSTTAGDRRCEVDKRGQSMLWQSKVNIPSSTAIFSTTDTMISQTLPEVDHFVPAPASKEAIDFAQLRTIDLAKYNQGEAGKDELAEEIRLAMTTQGFFYLTNYGIDEEDVTRQVDIGHTILGRTSPEEKQHLKADMIGEGSYHGFKPRGEWRNTGKVKDKVENFNVYRDMSLREQPKAMEPYKPEIQGFIDFTHKEILYKLLRLFARSLKIADEEIFVKLHDYSKHDETWLRYMEYYDEYTDDEKKTTGGLWLGGHQDLTSLSILFSQPMTSLQVRDFETNEWKFIAHKPGAIVVNGGEVLQWWTGNYYKSAIHRVFQPPVDQRGYNRCSVFYFVLPNDDVVINTLLDESSVLREAGVEMAHKTEDAPTSKAWCNGRIRVTGRSAVWEKKEGAGDVVEKIGGVTTKWYE